MERVNDIYNRGPDPESVEWKTQYQERLKEKEFRRNAKAQVTRTEYVKQISIKQMSSLVGYWMVGVFYDLTSITFFSDMQWIKQQQMLHYQW